MAATTGLENYRFAISEEQQSASSASKGPFNTEKQKLCAKHELRYRPVLHSLPQMHKSIIQLAKTNFPDLDMFCDP